MTGAAVDVSGLVKKFDGKTVVDHVSMRVEHGEIAGFLGPNGSGKTTTIRVMCGLLIPDGGGGTVLGYDLRQRHKIKREIGYMTQRFSLYEDLTIAENLDFVAGLYGLRPARRYVRDALADLGLTARRDQLAGTLSGGWKQRVALASCVMHNPKLLLLDEPTAGVDPKARREFWDEIHLRTENGLTVLVSTHYMDEAERCHRVNYISQGKLVASGSVAEVIAESRLTTWIVDGPHLSDAAHLLSGKPGVDEITHFGKTLHVVGRDASALERSVRAVARTTGVHAQIGDTTLEDAFISFMTNGEGGAR
ncbi:ABC transporter ATP-binding protein [Yoonia sediminilitoris]|uniref:ABC-2 type transport system ATP-binding protein n=1 Tax=Yoonia sediminilitoris TaxID=1286148 RepID=A0A2T6K8P7_9RHOB|nr:ABC transporter ATP-binding protein [Yoonia sediminilitoris]PUB11079.1 ABC-2 type transport system ATP-binding protein [Yoonia sediminilitoris]RCW90998.1 ABC-2 type transport system ATP-binding protein [Yoonia sediminilitoris]